MNTHNHQPVPSESDEAVAREMWEEAIKEVGFSGRVVLDIKKAAAILARHRQKPAEVSRTAEELAEQIDSDCIEFGEASGKYVYLKNQAAYKIQASLTAERMEGARLMQEEAAKKAVIVASKYTRTEAYLIEEAIRALRPEEIIKGK